MSVEWRNYNNNNMVIFLSFGKTIQAINNIQYTDVRKETSKYLYYPLLDRL